VSRASSNYFPLAALPLAVLFFGLAVLVIALELHLVEAAYEKLGVSPHHVVALLVATLVGSRFNLPVATLRGEQLAVERVVNVFGVPYVIPAVAEGGRTVIAVNLGGAVIPTLFSGWLLATRGPLLPALLTTAIVTAAVHALARPVRGVGIVVPTLLPPLVAAGTALLLASGSAPVAAYVGGTLGTLVGADLLNLARLRGLGAPVASIGGAGTFDGIFVTGILAVLLA